MTGHRSFDDYSHSSGRAVTPRPKQKDAAPSPDWEQGRTRPLGGVHAYLMIIDRDPKAVIKILQATNRTKAA